MKNRAYKKSITKEEISILPLGSFEGRIHLIDNYTVFRKKIHMIQSKKIIGFDSETRPSFRKGKLNQLSLLQLASEKDTYLLRINKLGLPLEVMDILEDPSIVKVGVGINNDLDKLNSIKAFHPQGFIELQKLVKRHGIEGISLQKMAAIVLQMRITKSQRTSNWEQEILTEAQQRYAATDAWLCYKIYKQLMYT